MQNVFVRDCKNFVVISFSYPNNNNNNNVDVNMKYSLVFISVTILKLSLMTLIVCFVTILRKNNVSLQGFCQNIVCCDICDADFKLGVFKMDITIDHLSISQREKYFPFPKLKISMSKGLQLNKVDDDAKCGYTRLLRNCQVGDKSLKKTNKHSV